ncbi:MAG: hypothetical protein JRI47_03315 [Deltaproteobacteria bacterium]|nr:hypothetical protein [Deltaproteobacteria bacterium]
MKDVIALRAEGTIIDLRQDPRVDLSLKMEKTDVKPAFNLFVLEPFRAGQPFLSSLDVNGLVSAGLRLKGSRAEWMVKGNCRWIEGLFS